MNQDRFNDVHKIISTITNKNAYKFKGISAEDLYQTLWQKFLTEEKKKGKELDLKLIYCICQRHVYTIQRKEIRNNKIAIDFIDNLSEEQGLSTVIDLIKDKESEELLNILLNKFPEDTLEGMYVRYWASSTKMFNGRWYPPSGNRLDYSHNHLATLMGFKECSHRAYYRAKRHVTEFLNELLKL